MSCCAPTGCASRVFYSWLQALFESCILIFSVHPFDVGDCLTVMRWLKVRKIGSIMRLRRLLQPACVRRRQAVRHEARQPFAPAAYGWLRLRLGTYARHERGPSYACVQVWARRGRVSAPLSQARPLPSADCVVTSARATRLDPDMAHGERQAGNSECRKAWPPILRTANPSEKPPTVLVSAIERG